MYQILLLIIINYIVEIQHTLHGWNRREKQIFQPIYLKRNAWLYIYQIMFVKIENFMTNL